MLSLSISFLRFEMRLNENQMPLAPERGSGEGPGVHAARAWTTLEDRRPCKSQVQLGTEMLPLTSRAQQQLQRFQNLVQTACLQSPAAHCLYGGRHEWSGTWCLRPFQALWWTSAAAMLSVAGSARR
jgi:hypothetical protein